MSTMSNQKKNQNEEKVWVEVEPITFDAHGQSKFITSLELAKLFNQFFKKFLVDYEGCFVTPKIGVIDRNDTFIELSLYLTNKTANTNSSKIKCLQPAVNPVNAQQNSISQRISSLNSRAKQKVYTVTEDCKGLFESLAYNNKWEEKMAVEQADPANRNIMFVKVNNIDPVKILKKIYGSNVDGEKYEYRISPVKVIGPNNYMLRIERLNENNMIKLAEDLGFVQPNASNIPMVHA